MLIHRNQGMKSWVSPSVRSSGGIRWPMYDVAYAPTIPMAEENTTRKGIIVTMPRILGRMRYSAEFTPQANHPGCLTATGLKLSPLPGEASPHPSHRYQHNQARVLRTAPGFPSDSRDCRISAISSVSVTPSISSISLIVSRY